MKLLLHICCAPCGIYPFKELLKNPDTQVKGFYFNPNIHPREEYLRRRSAVEAYSRDNNLEVIYPDYDPDYFFRKIADSKETPARCRLCWQMRLEETASYAKQNSLDAFSTTLLISPYQDHLVIKKIGQDLAARFKINFYYQDFRTGFRASQDEARGHNLYRQKYYGCKYSEMERSEKSART